MGIDSSLTVAVFGITYCDPNAKVHHKDKVYHCFFYVTITI